VCLIHCLAGRSSGSALRWDRLQVAELTRAVSSKSGMDDQCHVGLNGLATASALSSLVSKAIFCASITSPGTSC